MSITFVTLYQSLSCVSSISRSREYPLRHLVSSHVIAMSLSLTPEVYGSRARLNFGKSSQPQLERSWYLASVMESARINTTSYQIKEEIYNKCFKMYQIVKRRRLAWKQNQSLYFKSYLCHLSQFELYQIYKPKTYLQSYSQTLLLFTKCSAPPLLQASKP